MVSLLLGSVTFRFLRYQPTIMTSGHLFQARKSCQIPDTCDLKEYSKKICSYIFSRLKLIMRKIVLFVLPYTANVSEKNMI